MVMLAAPASARDSEGAHTMMPMKMLSTTKVVERGFNFRMLILM